VWVDRDGRQEPLSAPDGWIYPRISPDGKRVLSDRWPEEEGRDLYIWDLERETLSRLTDDPAEDLLPEWSADGSRIFFSSNRTGGPFNIYSRAADGTGSDERVLESDLGQMPSGLTPDGAQLLAVQTGPKGWDIVAIDLEQPGRARTLLATGASEKCPSASPDGRWVAYESDHEGRYEVFVGPFPDLGSRRWKISDGGGASPVWSSKGNEIFFRGPGGSMMAAQVALEPTFAPGEVMELFPNPSPGTFTLGDGGHKFDVSPVDGRFLMPKAEEPSQGERLVVVLNWFQELEAKVPVR
jgi:Tol biopolymer transport system component